MSLSASARQLPAVARYAAGCAALTVAPVFAWLGFVATRPRPPHAAHLVGRYVATGQPTGEGGPPPVWRAKFNRFNMASLELCGGAHVKGRVVHVKGGLIVESIWGSAGARLGLGFAPVQFQVAKWPGAEGQLVVTTVDAGSHRLFAAKDGGSLRFVREHESG